jgi:hypothetical protein
MCVASVVAASLPALATAALREVKTASYLRVVEEPGRSVALEVASRPFVPAGGAGPRVSLVGVAHIGDRQFYRDLQRHLDAHDLVLYESVLPPGARGPGGETDEQRAESTLAAMQFIASLVASARAHGGAYPASLEELADVLGPRDARLAGWLVKASVDAWGGPVRYELEEVAREGGGPGVPAGAFRLTSLGADGQEGGAGAGSDLLVTSADGVPAYEANDYTRLQTSLARALGLEFQLDAIEYGGAGWQPSDMAMDEIDRALEARGVDVDLAAGMLMGDFPEGVIRFLLGAIRMLDALLGGAIADTCKVLIIEMLGDERVIEQSLDQLGPGFAEVIVGMRNQVVIDDLRARLQAGQPPRSVAIFYGAAHMGDLEKRLKEQLGYVPADGGSGTVTWHRAMGVDLRTSSVSPEQLQQLRAAVRQMMKLQAMPGDARSR